MISGDRDGGTVVGSVSWVATLVVVLAMGFLRWTWSSVPRTLIILKDGKESSRRRGKGRMGRRHLLGFPNLRVIKNWR